MEVSNFYWPKLTCEKFKSKREANENMIVYFGYFKKTLRHEDYYAFNHLRIFD